MKKYVDLNNDFFELIVPANLQSYGKEVLEYSTNKLKSYLAFFQEETYGSKIKGAFLTSREDFIARIKEVSSPNSMPPEWATGCFYGGETQILLDEKSPYDMFLTLAHESFHLLFSKFIYEKYNFNRIVWLDESLACNFDGTTEKIIDNGTFQKLIIKLIHTSNLPKMNDLSFSKGNIKTKEYNGYDLFKIVGRYLIETKNKTELLTYISNREKVIKDGNTILQASLNYFKSKYNLN